MFEMKLIVLVALALFAVGVGIAMQKENRQHQERKECREFVMSTCKRDDVTASICVSRLSVCDKGR